LYEKANEIVRAVAKQEKVFLIDLEAEIPSTNEYIYDEVHLNTNGSKLVAEKITAALKTRYSSVYR
jgi:lysophospholipase L1-like esterase